MNGRKFGCYTALVTPFERTGNRWNHPINFHALDSLVEFQIRGGVDGLVIMGSTGAASVVSHDEHVHVVAHVQKKFGEKIQVIAGDGSNCTKEAIELARRIEQEAKVFAHLSISPYYNKPSDSGIIQHYKAIADNLEGNIIVYSVPSRTSGLGILPDMAEELAEYRNIRGRHNIIGIKEASGDIERIRETIKRTHHKNFVVISGDDSLTLPIIRIGGVGVISVASNILPSDITNLVHIALGTQNEDRYYKIKEDTDKKLQPLYSALFPKARQGVIENPSANPCLCYYALNKMGYNIGIPRLPLTDGESWEKEAMNKALRDLKLIKD